jgi:ubiquinol-cytochrome c reductase cytochrome c1 subunit
MKKLLISLFVACGFALSALPAAANEGGYPWDKFPEEKMTDMAALQNGARIFVNYCLNCHSAQYMRYNRLQDIGLNDDQIKKNLLFATEKVGDTMKTTLDPKQAKDFFGAAPPDLSVIACSRAEIGSGSGADISHLRGAPSTATTPSRPAGTTSRSPTSPCRTRSGSFRANAVASPR